MASRLPVGPDRDPATVHGQFGRAVAVAAVDARDAPAERVEGLRCRMAVAVAAASLDRRDLRLQPVEQLRKAGVRASVVRNLHSIDARQVERQQDRAFGVRRQEEVEGTRADDRDRRPFIRVGRRRLVGAAWWRPQDVDRDAADVNALAGAGRSPRDPPAVDLVLERDKARVVDAVAAVEEQPYGEPPDDLEEASVMVARLVCGDQHADLADAEAPQGAVDARLGDAAVEEDGSTCRVSDQRRVALADIDEVDREVTRWRRRGGGFGGGGQRERGERSY